jgi:hypothetical protein
MTDRSFDSLVPLLQPSVPGCPQPTIVEYIRNSAIRTCERTLYWRYQVPTFTLSPGVLEYAYIKPLNTDVHVLFDAMVNCSPLERLTLEQAIYKYPCWADLFSGVNPQIVWQNTPGGTYNTNQYNQIQYNGGGNLVLPPEALEDASTPRSITQLTPDKFIILPLPDDEQEYKVRMFVALKPKRNATGMDEFVFNELEDIIMHNALQHLLVLPSQAWSNQDLAAYHARQYVFQVAERRARSNLTNARGTFRVQMQPFGV